MGYKHAAATMPRSLAAVLKDAQYGATAQVPQVSAAYVKAMRDRDARAFWGSAVARPVQADARPVQGTAAYDGPAHSARARA